MTVAELLERYAKRQRYFAGADLTRVDLRWANLRWANLTKAGLRGADLRRADLRGADLRRADLRGADLRGADLQWADLTGAKGLPTQEDFLAQFERDEVGVYVFKVFGCFYKSPDSWLIGPGRFVVAEPGPDRRIACDRGVNFGTLGWVQEAIEEQYLRPPIWLCRIHRDDLDGVVVPYAADGKARCRRLEILEVWAS